MKAETKNTIHRYLAVFLTFAAIVAFAFLLINVKSVQHFFRTIVRALTPVWIGITLAYILNPLVRIGERLLTRRHLKQNVSRGITLAVLLLFILVLLFLIIGSIAPRLVGTINNLIPELPSMERTFNSYLKTLGDWDKEIYDAVTEALDTVVQWGRTNILSAISSLTQSLIGIISSVINVFVGLIVFIYVQLRKERFIGEGKKLLYAVSSNTRVNDWLLDIARQTNHIFTGFISAKIIDSAIVGLICFLCLFLLQMPYPLLISVVIGVTNIIPMFGPLIGAIPCAILLLFIDPWKCLIFVILIIILQQVDGNIIAPRILGNSTGLSAFWVIVAILLFGNLMGFVGMIVGVPIFASLYYIIKKIVEESLRRKNLPVNSMDYVNVDHIDQDHTIVYVPEKEKKKTRGKPREENKEEK